MATRTALAAILLLALPATASAQTATSPAAPGAVFTGSAAAGGAMATGAGRDGELDENARIDAYLSDAAASRAPSVQAQGRVTAAEASAGARALPPMAPDSPWARGVPTPLDGPLSLAGVSGPAPCDHRVHGEVGAEIGTGGEKGGYGVATVPVGKNCQAQVTVGVSSYHGRGYGGYGGAGYGGGGYGYGRNRTQDALSLGFSSGFNRSQPAPEPDSPPEF